MHYLEGGAYPNLTIEPSAQSKRETIQWQRRERAKSDFDREILNEEVFCKIRLIDGPAGKLRAGVSSDQASLADSDSVTHQRVYRRLSLNCEKSQDPLSDYVPFSHKELYPSSVQKYIANSQRTRQFLVGEAISKLKIPKKKSHTKNLDKMRLLGLVQERQIDELMNSRRSHSTGSDIESPGKLFSPVDTEQTNMSDISYPKPSKFLQEASQDSSPQRVFSDGITQMPYQGNRNEGLRIPNFQSQGISAGLMSSQLPMGFAQNQYQYPQQQGLSLSALSNASLMDSRRYSGQGGVYENPYESNGVQNLLISQGTPVSQTPQNRGANIKEAADQQLMKINNLMVRKPKRLYKVNTIDIVPSTGGNSATQYYSPGGIDSPNTPRSDCSVGNLNIIASNVTAGLSISTNMTAEISNGNAEMNSANAVKADDKKSEGNFTEQTNNLASSLLAPPAKKTRKPVYRVNTDPTQLDSLIQTMNLQTPVSGSPRHSTNGAFPNQAPLSQFSQMSINSNQGNGTALSSRTIRQIPPRGLQAAFSSTPVITGTLQENLPGPPKKKKGMMKKMNTDPTNLAYYSEAEANALTYSNLQSTMMSPNQ